MRIAETTTVPRAPKLKLIKSPKWLVKEQPVFEAHSFQSLVRWDDELWDFCDAYKVKYGYEPNTLLVEPGYLRLMVIALNNHPELWEGATDWVEFDRLYGAYDIDFSPNDTIDAGIVMLGWTEPEPKWD